MPTISSFFGVAIRMHVEIGAQHHRPHLHAHYQNYSAIYAIDELEMLRGNLPKRYRRLVEKWIVLHREELLANWKRLQSGRPSVKIRPLD